MREVEIIQKNDTVKDKTVSLRRLIGARVLSADGLVVGRIREVRTDPKNMNLLGIVVYRGLFNDKLYIGKSYFEKISNDAAILNIDPFIFLKGKVVVTSDGKVIGKIKDIARSDYSNGIESIIVTSWFKRYNIDADSIKLVGRSVILKVNYDGTKKYIEQRSR